MRLHPLLICRSHYSFLQEALSPEEIVAAAKKAGASAVVLADREGIYGAVEFFRCALAAAIHPILGAEFEELGKRIWILAKNRTGYSVLCGLVTRWHLDSLAAREILHCPSGDVIILCEDARMAATRRQTFPDSTTLLAVPYGNGRFLWPSPVPICVPAIPVILGLPLSADERRVREVARAIRKRNVVARTAAPAEEEWPKNGWSTLAAAPEGVLGEEMVTAACSVDLEKEGWSLPVYRGKGGNA